MRAADVAAGGQGAPLVPVYHRALAARLKERPVAFVNIGGVANMTWIGQEGELVAFDTGPGNALINDWCERHTDVPFDRDGALAAAGNVATDALGQLLKSQLFCNRSTQIPRPQRLRCQRSGWPFAGGRRGNPHPLHRRGHRRQRRPGAGSAEALHHLRRRPAQSHAHAGPEGSAPSPCNSQPKMLASTATRWKPKPGPIWPSAA